VWASVVSAAFILLAGCRALRRQGSVQEPIAAERPASRWPPTLILWCAMVLVGIFLGYQTPERVYNRGWEAMRADRYTTASQEFERAYRSRRPQAKKEEALFWTAKANELAGNRKQAKARYRELIERFHGYWIPESLYTYVVLERMDGKPEEAAPFAAKLRAEYPGNIWTLKLDEKS
jgi:TolA-binding protein